MEKLDIYISEIKSLNFHSIGRFADLNDYASIQSGYPAELNNLEKNALNELGLLSFENIRHQLILLYRLDVFFKQFDKIYPELFMQSQQGKLTRNQVFEFLNLIFNSIKLDDDITSATSIMEIYSVILTKHNSLLSLINKTEDLLLDRALKKREMSNPLVQKSDSNQNGYA